MRVITEAKLSTTLTGAHVSQTLADAVWQQLNDAPGRLRLVQREATEANLRAKIAGRQIVHLACHGLTDAESLNSVSDRTDGARDFPAWHVGGLGQAGVVLHVATAQQHVDESDRGVGGVDGDLSWTRCRIGL